MTTIDIRARAALRGVRAYQPGKPIAEVQRELGLRRVIKLASNENALGPSPKAAAAVRKAIGDLHRYPDGGCYELRARLAKRLKVDPAQLVFGNGSDELLVLALRAFVEPGDEVVVAEPTFLVYAIAAQACGARVVTVPLRNYRYDLPAMARAVTAKTKLVFIANPDNPTGTYVTQTELARFLRELPAPVLTVLDEAYYEFADAKDYPQTLPWVGQHPLLVTRTFSKAYGLAGLRVGYGIAQPGIIAALNAVREPFNVNSLAQAGAAAALTDTAFLSRSRALVRQGRRYLTAELTTLGMRVVPGAANFLLVEAPAAAALAAALLRRGVIVREMSAWKLSGYLRVTIGTMDENRRFIRELTQCLKP